jgi:hypothetical protein
MRSTSVVLLTTLLLVAGCDRPKPGSDPPKSGTVTPMISTGQPQPTGPGRAKPTTTVSADQPVAFAVTASQLQKEIKAGVRAAISKYNGKRIEVSGKVLGLEATEPPKFGLWNPDNPDEGAVIVELRMSEAKKPERLKALALNQPVVVRGTVELTDLGNNVVYSRVLNAELVTIGPSSARPTTVRDLSAEFKKPGGAKKVTGVDWIIRASVLGNEKQKQWGHVLRITDPGLAGPVVQAHGLIQDTQWTELKPGAEIVIIGRYHIVPGIDDTTPVLNDARILSAPPEGVVLPEPAKK